MQQNEDADVTEEFETAQTEAPESGDETPEESRVESQPLPSERPEYVTRAADRVIFTVGDTVKLAETFPSYRGELGKVTKVRMDPAGGGFPVADVELLKQTQVTDGAPIWFSNVALKDIEKV